MFLPSRRAFLGASLAGLVAGQVLGDDKPAAPAVKATDDPAFQPNTLFLTWQRDPMFAVIGGDLGYYNGVSVEISLAFLRNYSKTMIGRDGRLIPMVTAIGNHEVVGGYNKTRDKAPFFYALFDGLYPETGYATL